MKRRGMSCLTLTGLLGLLAVDACVSTGSRSGAELLVPMSAELWTPEPAIASMGDTAASVHFARYEGMPLGTMTLNEGEAALRAEQFATGSIDFDIKPIGYDDAGIVFHRDGATDGDFFYLRGDPECPAADDCIQYAPIAHGMMGWNVYPNYQGPAPIASAGWNHVHIEIVGDGMRVYINRSAEPSLVVPTLRGARSGGGIAFKGPAVYANLVLRHGTTAAQTPVPAASATPGTIVAWRAAPPTVYHRGAGVLAQDAPPAGSWRPIAVQPTGLVDLGIAYGLAHAPLPSIAWLRADIDASAAVRRILQVGFAEEVWVFLNGRQVYAGVNQYFPPAARLSPDGRLEPDNAAVPLDLRKGRNEITLAVGNDWHSRAGPLRPSDYGWAAEAHLPETDGLDLH